MSLVETTKSLMSILDDIKDKISDGEYLNMSNLLKDLFTNNKKNKELITSDENDVNHDEEKTSSIHVDMIFKIEKEVDDLDELICDRDFMRVFHNQRIRNNYFKYNRFLNYTDNFTYYCPCGKQIDFNQVLIHIETPEHNQDFHLDQFLELHPLTFNN